MELATGASPTWDHAAFLAGKQTPVFFGRQPPSKVPSAMAP